MSECLADYQRTVSACGLRHDVDSLSDGDLTVIGDQGSTLSGGQKQRVSLARAVYADADVYLLDDVLSAVDSGLAQRIFDKVWSPLLRVLCAGAARVVAAAATRLLCGGCSCCVVAAAVTRLVCGDGRVGFGVFMAHCTHACVHGVGVEVGVDW